MSSSPGAMRERPRALARCLAAEWAKITTLRACLLAALGTVVTGALVTAALAASTSADASQAIATGGPPELLALPFTQVGMILLGILPAAHEYAGRQIAATLVAVPRRSTLLAGKTLATLTATTVTAIVAVAASVGARSWARHRADVVSGGAADAASLACAVCYLALIAMLAFAAALLMRGLLPALVATLALVLVVPPLLGAIPRLSRWLPSEAGAALYRWDASGVPPSPGLAPLAGALALLAWIGVIGAAAAFRFTTRDA